VHRERAVTARVPLLACVAVLAFFAGITGIHLAYTLAYVLVLLLAVAYIWSRLLAMSSCPSLRSRRRSGAPGA